MVVRIKGLLTLLLFLTSPSIQAQTMSDAVRKAMQTHPEILQQAMQENAARWGIREAQGAYYPLLDLDGGYGREMTESPITRDL